MQAGYGLPCAPWRIVFRPLTGATGCGAHKRDPPAGRGGRGRPGDRPRRRSQEIDAGLLGTCGVGSLIRTSWPCPYADFPPRTCRRLGLGCSAKGRMVVPIYEQPRQVQPVKGAEGRSQQRPLGFQPRMHLVTEWVAARTKKVTTVFVQRGIALLGAGCFCPFLEEGRWGGES